MPPNSPTPKAVDLDDPKYRTTLYEQAASSCTGAIITSLFVTPLDVVKIRLQVQQQKNLSQCFLYCNGLMDHLCTCQPGDVSKQWFQRPGHFNGTIDAFIKITRHEGIFSLWSGLSPTLVLAIPMTILYFVSYEQLRVKMKDYYNRNKMPEQKAVQPFWIPLAAGASARVVAASIVSPLELIRTKMQSQKLSYLEIGDALKILVEQNGWQGLWKGIFPTLLRDVPFSAIYWMTYEGIKKLRQEERPSFGLSFFAGAFAGGVAATVTVPFDVVKTHQQIEFGQKAIFGEAPKKSSGTFQLLGEIYRQQGFRGWFAGLTPRLIKVAPACAIMISTFEYGKVFFNRLPANSVL